FFSFGLYIRIFPSESSQTAIRQLDVDYPPLIAKLLKQLLSLLNTLQPIVEIGDRRGQVSRRQQSVAALDRNRTLRVFQCTLQPATPFLEKSAQFPEIQFCAQLCNQSQCLLAIVNEQPFKRLSQVIMIIYGDL